MDYTRSVTVAGERDAVAALFVDYGTWAEWQPSLLSIEVLEGAPPAHASRSRLTFRRGTNGTMVMTETVDLDALPERWSVVYEVSGVRNVCETRFERVDARTTLVEQHNVFRFSGFMRVVGLLFARSFPAETQKSLDAFRDFVSSRTSA